MNAKGLASQPMLLIAGEVGAQQAGGEWFAVTNLVYATFSHSIIKVCIYLGKDQYTFNVLS